MTLRTVLASIVLACAACSPQPAASPVAPPPETPAEEPPVAKFTNRLAQSSSPYLLQHAHNPVDWLPWGESLSAALLFDYYDVARWILGERAPIV